jgi:signal peptidase I
MTDRSLKMNNFAEGKFRSNYTSFWPKTSFNKIVNLNIINSGAFLENLVGGGKNLKLMGNSVQRSVKFYNRNSKELMKEGLLTKFDNVTFKTIRPNNKIESRELEKFLKNYEIEKKNDLTADIEKKILEY